MSEKFKAVEFQREIRKKLGKKYNTNRKVFLCDLKEEFKYLNKSKKPARTSDNLILAQDFPLENPP